jgi:hypothetical protein
VLSVKGLSFKTALFTAKRRRQSSESLTSEHAFFYNFLCMTPDSHFQSRLFSRIAALLSTTSRALLRAYTTQTDSGLGSTMG